MVGVGLGPGVDEGEGVLLGGAVSVAVTGAVAEGGGVLLGIAVRVAIYAVA